MTEKYELNQYEGELLIEIVDGEIENRGYGAHTDDGAFDRAVEPLAAHLRELLEVAYLIGFEDGVSRMVHGQSYFEHTSEIADRLREVLEQKFEPHRQRWISNQRSEDI